MPEEDNKLVVQRFISELWNERKLELAEELIAANCVTHQLCASEAPEGAPRSPESVRREVAGWVAGFPDLTLALEQLVAAGDLVVARCTMSATHTGPWMGIAPTGKRINVPIVSLHRVADGRIVEDWVLVGSLALFQQLGLVPSTEEIVRPAGK